MRLWGKPLFRRSGNKKSPDLTGSDTIDSERIAQLLGSPPDLVSRTLLDTISGDITALYFATLVDEESFKEFVLVPLTQGREPILTSTCDPDQVQLPIGQISCKRQINAIADAILDGKVALLRQGEHSAFIVTVKGPATRQLTESPLNRTTRGSRVSFIEDLDTNVGLIRRQLRDPRLRFDEFVIGERTRTKVLIGYLSDIVREDTVNTIKERVAKIDIDGVLASGYLEQLIEEHPLSPFPQMVGTESPNKIVSGLLEGQVVILVSGTPFALSGPTVFASFFQAQEDYAERLWIGNLYRSMRFAAMLVAWTLPALWVALTTYNPELMPIKIATAIARSRSDVPFPPVIEALLFEVVLDLIREMGLRLPSPLGQTVGVVGGIVLGDASIRTGLVSPGMLVVVVLTTISSFVTPVYTMAQTHRLIRFPLLLLTALFGVFGLAVGLLFLLAHLCSLDSFGIPYLSPVAPVRFSDIKDTFIRAPLQLLRNRPSATARPSARKRQGDNQ